MEPMYYIGLDVHKRKISYCVKDSSGKICAEGSLPGLPISCNECPAFQRPAPRSPTLGHRHHLRRKRLIGWRCIDLLSAPRLSGKSLANLSDCSAAQLSFLPVRQSARPS
jgi:hypothetical protein